MMTGATIETIADVRAAIAAGTSAVAVCTTFLERIRERNADLGAFTHVASDTALEEAAAVDARGADDPGRPLSGVPIAIKDNICTRGVPTTAASRILADYRPPYDATVVERLRAAGAVIIGKTNCDEFAMGSTTEHSCYGVTRNPWDRDRVPGGSSGGSAAAVAARLAPVSLGSDTGGSIRQPAAFCGIVGLKPTYGRVSRYGLLAFASSLDQIGPLALTVTDVATVFRVIGGEDPADATSAAEAVPAWPSDAPNESPTIGVPWALLQEGIADDVLASFRSALETLRSSGVTIVDVELPHAAYAVPTYYVVAPAEASSNLARYDGVRYGVRAALADTANLTAMYDLTREGGFGDEVKRRIMLGTYALSAGYYDAYYLRAQQIRTLIRRDYDSAFSTVDAVALPTTPTTAFTLGQHADDPLQLYVGDVFTASANLTGLPALSVPSGLDGSGLPVGLQLVGRAFDEVTILDLAARFERDRPDPIGRPELAATS